MAAKRSKKAQEDMHVGEIGALAHDVGDLRAETVEGIDEEVAWCDVTDIELPFEMVRKARREEMEHMKGKIFRGSPRRGR